MDEALQLQRAILLQLKELNQEAKRHTKELSRKRRLLSLGLAWALFLVLNVGVTAYSAGVDSWNAIASSRAGQLLGLEPIAAKTPKEPAGVADRHPLVVGDKVGQWTVTSGFGPRASPCPGCSSNHRGVDFDTPTGTKLVMPYPGKVSCSWENGGGNVARVTPAGGEAPTLLLLHLTTCKAGTHQPGEEIARSGSTGLGTGPHLHLEEWVSGKPVHPTRGWAAKILGVSGGGDADALRRAIIGQESGGNFQAVNPDSGALGYGQIMPANLPSWSRAALGREVARAEFLRSPEIQIAIINHKLQEYLQEELAQGVDRDTAIRRVASRWYSGRAHLYADTRRQFYGGREYPSIDSYTRSILKKYHQENNS